MAEVIHTSQSSLLTCRSQHDCVKADGWIVGQRVAEAEVEILCSQAEFRLLQVLILHETRHSPQILPSHKATAAHPRETHAAPAHLGDQLSCLIIGTLQVERSCTEGEEQNRGG